MNNKTLSESDICNKFIVERVIELRRLCADLRERLDRNSVMQAALAEALIDQALAA